MKKIFFKALTLTLTAIICTASSGCELLDDDVLPLNSNIKKFKNDDGVKYNDINKLDASTPYIEATLDYGYSSLKNDTEKHLYSQFEIISTSVSDEADEDGLYSMDIVELTSGTLTEGQIRTVIEAFSCDHPETFWISNVFGYYTDDKTTMVHLYSTFSSKEINRMQAELNVAIKGFLEDIPNELDDYTLEKLIHDKLLAECSYANDVKSSQDNPSAFTLYGALVDDVAVCEGYTSAVQYLLKMVGIKTISINGYSKNELHQWCLVNINDKWYHLDPTWNDKDTKDESDSISYLYFNVPDKYISADHTIAKSYTDMTEDELCGNDEDKTQIFNLPLPECSSEDDSFYNKDGVTITKGVSSYDDYNNMINAISAVASEKGKHIYIKVADKLDYDKIVDSLFNKDPYEFFEYTADVNNGLSGYKISDSLSMLTMKDQRIIQVELSYE